MVKRMPSKEDLIRRAHAAWLTYRRNRAEPTWSATTVEVYDGRTYVVLRRGGQVIDIYRYVPATPGMRDTLKPLRRYWPGPYGRQRVAA
jgi:hypothetical protein